MHSLWGVVNGMYGEDYPATVTLNSDTSITANFDPIEVLTDRCFL